MSDLRNNNITRILFEYFPMIWLFGSVMNDFDFNDVGLKYFSFNFSYILIFYYTLKRKEALGYVYDINHTNSIVNTLFTFIFYIFFTYIFHFIENFFIGYRNAE